MADHDVDHIAAVVDALERWVPALLPEPDRSARIVEACRAAADALPPATALPAALGAIERAAHAHSRHVLLFVEPAGELVPDDEPRGWPAPDLRAIRRRAGGVRRVERDDDGLVTIEIDRLEPFDVAEPFLEAAAVLAASARGVLLDLRRNGGGDVVTAAFLAGVVLGPVAEPLAIVHGADGADTWTTVPPGAGSCVPADVPVAVLTSDETFSAAEALAFHLQARGRAIVVGARTPGAADLATPITLTSHVHAQLPVARVVDACAGTSWEGTGVVPDVACDAGDAAIVAAARLRELRA